MGTPFGGIVFIVAVALVYVLYRVVVGTNIEFEYCFTNGALDVDKIINVQRRKRLAELNARKIDIMASANHSEYRRYLENCIRETFGFRGTPIKLIIRQKGDDKV